MRINQGLSASLITPTLFKYPFLGSVCTSSGCDTRPPQWIDGLGQNWEICVKCFSQKHNEALILFDAQKFLVKQITMLVRTVRA